MSDFLRRLGIEHPIILAPMAGGAGTPELVAAVSNAGGLGSWGGAYSTPQQILDAAGKIRALTGKPFGVSLDYYRYFLVRDPQWSGTTMNRAEFELLMNQSAEEFGAVIGSDIPDLARFRDRGGYLTGPPVRGVFNFPLPVRLTHDYFPLRCRFGVMTSRKCSPRLTSKPSGS